MTFMSERSGDEYHFVVPIMDINPKEIVYSPNKYRETEGIKGY